MPSGHTYRLDCLKTKDWQCYFLFTPVPVKGTSTGLPGALVGTFRVAVSVPTASGEKVTPMMQLLPGLSGLPQKRWKLKSLASPSMTVSETEPISTAVVPTFSSFTFTL